MVANPSPPMYEATALYLSPRRLICAFISSWSKDFLHCQLSIFMPFVWFLIVFYCFIAYFKPCCVVYFIRILLQRWFGRLPTYLPTWSWHVAEKIRSESYQRKICIVQEAAAAAAEVNLFLFSTTHENGFLQSTTFKAKNVGRTSLMTSLREVFLPGF